MSKKLISTLSVLALAGMASTAAQALPTPVFTELSVYTQAHVAGVDVAWDSDLKETMGTSPMAAVAGILSEFDGASANSFGLGSYNYSSPAAGNLSFFDIGWVTKNLLDGRVQLTARFLYEFTMNENGKFNLLWDIGSIERDGLSDPAIGNFNFSISGVGSQVLERDTGQGFKEASFDLFAGTTYKMLIQGDWSAEGPLGTQWFRETGSFMWNITPTSTQVPEPSGLMLLGLSLALLFGVQKRGCQGSV